MSIEVCYGPSLWIIYILFAENSKKNKYKYSAFKTFIFLMFQLS